MHGIRPIAAPSLAASTSANNCHSRSKRRSLPYLPFVEALRGYIVQRDLAALESELGADAGEVARIIPEVGERLLIASTPSSDPEDDRRRLLQAVVRLFRNAASDRPLLLVLEDLH